MASLALILVCFSGFCAAIPVSSPEHIICMQATWEAIIVFLVTNYGVHALTVKYLPGETGWKAIFWICIALFIPFSAVWHGARVIMAGKKYGESDLSHTTRTGALCTLVQTNDWRPLAGECINGRIETKDITILSDDDPEPDMNESPLKETPLMEIPPTKPQSTTDEQRQELDSSVEPPSDENEIIPVESIAMITAVVGNSWIGLCIEDIATPPLDTVHAYYVHGLYPSPLPDGYAFKIVPDDLSLSTTDESVKLYSTRSIIGAAAAIFSVIQTAITLYHTRGDQVEKWGYAAYGLSAIPYLLMSGMNLLANMVTPDYGALFMLRSEVMDEAEQRGYKFDGTVGRLDIACESGELRPFAVHSVEEIAGDKTTVRVKVTEIGTGIREADPTKEVAVVGVETLEPMTGTDIEAIPSGDNQQHKDIQPNESQIAPYKNPTELPADLVIPSLGRSAKSNKIVSRQEIAFRILGYLVLAVTIIMPYVLIYILTKFQEGSESTSQQRSFMMTWLVAGQLIGLTSSRWEAEKWGPGEVFNFIGLTNIFAAVVLWITVIEMMQASNICEATSVAR